MATRSVDLYHLMQGLNGSPTLLGTIVATTTKNNSDTGTPFNTTGELLKGLMLMVQPDAACYIYVGDTTATAATSSHVYLDAREKYILTMKSGNGYLACLSISGTTNLRVFQIE